MKLITVTRFTLLFITIMSSSLFAQTGILTTGIDIESINETVSMSIGQVFIEENAITGFVNRAGVQQTFQNRPSSSSDYIMGNLRIHPNPCGNALQLNIHNAEIQGESDYDIFSITGQKIKNGSLNDLNQMIFIGDLSPGIYLFILMNENYQYTEKFSKL